MPARPSPIRPLAAALAALAATLLLAGFGPPLRGLAAHLPWGAFGLFVVGGVGLLAHHLARLTVAPCGGGSLAASALPAALIPVAVLPQLGAGAIAVPLLLSLAAARTRRLALLVPLAIGGALVGGSVGAACLAPVALAVAAFLRPLALSSNDNDPRNSGARLWPAPAIHAIGAGRDSSPACGE